jgi:hypothetical protein
LQLQALPSTILSERLEKGAGLPRERPGSTDREAIGELEKMRIAGDDDRLLAFGQRKDFEPECFRSHRLVP